MAEHSSTDGILLIAVLLNSLLWGLVSQQFYAYWNSGFGDPIYLKIFVIVQFLLTSFQCALSWHFAFRVLIVSNGVSSGPPRAQPWEGPLNSLFQIFIILFANMFLAVRIQRLTKSVIRTGMVIILSLVAFTSGWINIMATWKPTHSAYKQSSSLVWHVTQAAAECLISYFLLRVFLKSRSGVHSLDSILNHLIHTAIQTGILATAWAIAALVAFFFLPKITVYRIFDMTSGTVYVRAVFNTLLLRVQLRERMATTTHLPLGLLSQRSMAIGRLPGSIGVSKVAPEALNTDEPRAWIKFPHQDLHSGAVVEEEDQKRNSTADEQTCDAPQRL